MGDGTGMDEDFNGAKVALFIGDKLITTLRDDKPDIPFPNMWDFPGGGREGDETPFETMARETLEEVSLIVPEAAVIWRKRYMWASTAKEPSWFFVARLPQAMEAQIVLGDEGQAWKLVTPEAFLAMPDTIPNMTSRFQDWMSATGD
jgi:8-oxo-dGTP diphosphatase